MSMKNVNVIGALEVLADASALIAFVVIAIAVLLAPSPAAAQSYRTPTYRSGYSATPAGTVNVEMATVLAVTVGEVVPDGRDYTGAAIGGAVGSALAYKLSRKSRRTTGNVLLAATGGILGASIGRAVQTRPRYRTVVVVRTDRGATLALPYTGIALRVGEQVAIGNGVVIPLGTTSTAGGAR